MKILNTIQTKLSDRIYIADWTTKKPSPSKNYKEKKLQEFGYY